ncbi:MAG: exodeoxyribonuclease III [Gammaproteobacteria bacterium]|nr:exodeoxyribonuclease III [Gammaproteobacteria bacterium]
MKIATWNVNSVRARMAHLLDWLERSSPDIVGLQETKVVDADFPIEPINELGYQVVYTGQKSYNGVAILSLKPARDVCVQLEGAEDYGARFIAATFDDSKGESFRFINAYVINGREVGAPAYDDKLNFLARLQAHVQQAVSAGNEVAVVGDFNIAPADADVYDPEEWRDKILCSVPERAAMQNLLSQVGLHDTLRELHPGEALHTWWDYRGARYQRRQGIRIDHILLSPALRTRCTNCSVDEYPRQQLKPSDHTPVIAEF